MNASQQSYTQSSSQASTSVYTIPSFPSSFSTTPFLSQDATTISTLVDPNSPETFKQNIQIALDHVARINSLARNSLHGVQNAFHAGNNPAQTEADLIALDRTLRTLADFLKQTGLGAYPLPPTDPQSVASSPPTEQQLIADTSREVQQLYEKMKRIQESNAVVA
ncbi:hypothetical protein ID866_10181, partial [Astraeus odoratus]